MIEKRQSTLDGVAFRRIALLVVAVIAALSFLRADPASAVETVRSVNDDFEDARIIRGASTSVFGNNRLATREIGEADHILSGSSVGQKSVWYRWTVWRGVMAEADVCESNFDSVLAVYARNDEGELEQVADNDDGCSEQNQRGSSLIFEADIRETYWISVSGYSNVSTGAFDLKLSPALPPN